jgi:hypothetical protein
VPLVLGQGEALAWLDQLVGQRDRLDVLLEALPNRAGCVV